VHEGDRDTTRSPRSCEIQPRPKPRAEPMRQPIYCGNVKRRPPRGHFLAYLTNRGLEFYEPPGRARDFKTGRWVLVAKQVKRWRKGKPSDLAPRPSEAAVYRARVLFAEQLKKEP